MSAMSPSTRRHLAWWALAAVPVLFFGALFAWPTLTLMSRGFDDGTAIRVLSSQRTWRAVATTLQLASAGTALSLALGVPAAWAVYRLRWPGSRIMRTVIAVPFAMPTVVVGLAFAGLFRDNGALGALRWDQSMPAIVAALAFYNTSVVTRIVGGTWANLDPATAVAARTLGAGRGRAFASVTLPALAPAMWGGAAVAFLFSATSFGVVLIIGGTRINTIETEIWIHVNQFLDIGAATTLALLQLGVVALGLGVASWLRRRREVAQGGRGRDGTRPARGRDIAGIALATVPLGLLLTVPLLTLAQRSLRTRDGYGLDNYLFLLDPPQRGVLGAPVWRAVVHSLQFAAIAATIAVAVGIVTAHVVARASLRAAWLDGFVTVPLGISAVIVGLGMLITLARPLPGGLLLAPQLLIPLGQAVIATPLVVRVLAPVLRAQDPHLALSAAVLGASPPRAWWAVSWPAIRRPVGLAAGLAFAAAMGEFGATAFLARPETQTLPTVIVRLLGRPGLDNAGMACAAAVLLAIVTGVAMAVAERSASGRAVGSRAAR